MPTLVTFRRRRTQAALGVGVSVVLVAATSTAAHADRGPTYPSAAEVAAATTAVSSTQSQIAGLDASLAEARATLGRLSSAAAVSDMAAHSADLLLAQRTTQSQAAVAAASSAGTRADDADLALSMFAAQVFQQGGSSLSELGLFLDAGARRRRSTGPPAWPRSVTSTPACGPTRRRPAIAPTPPGGPPPKPSGGSTRRPRPPSGWPPRPRWTSSKPRRRPSSCRPR